MAMPIPSILATAKAIVHEVEKKDTKAFNRLLNDSLKLLEKEQQDLLLQAIFKRACQKGIDDIQDWCVKGLTVEQMETILNRNWSSLSQEVAKELPEDLSILDPLPAPSEGRRSLMVFNTFFPHLIDTFLRSFNPSGARVPINNFEGAVLLEIYLKFCMIPVGIAYGLAKILPSKKKVILVAAVIYAIALSTLYLYLRYRPIPKILPESENLTLKAKKGLAEKVIGREEIIRRLSITNRNTILVGPMGVGKSMIVEGLSAKLPKEVQLISINLARLDRFSFNGYTEQMGAVLDSVKGHEKNYVFFLDQGEVAMKEKGMGSSLQRFLMPFLDRRRDGVRFIFATTEKNFAKFKEANEESLDRLEVIKIDSPPQEEIEEMLQDYVLREIKDVVIEPEALNEAAKHYPRKAFQYLDNAIEKARLSLSYFELSDVAKQEQNIRRIRNARLLGADLPIPELDKDMLKTQKTALKRLKTIRHLFKLEVAQKHKEAKMAKHLVDLLNKHQVVTVETKKEFLLAHYLKKRLTKMSKESETKLPNEVKVRVDKDFMTKIIAG